MQQRITISISLVITLSMLLLSSCGKFDLFKDMSVSLPSIEMVSAQPYNDSTLIIADVTDEGAAVIEAVGICYNTTGNPKMHENQMLFQGVLGEFGVLCGDMEPGQTYYIKAFATNDFGYDITDDFVYTLDPAGPIEVPCDPPANKLNNSGSMYTLMSVYEGTMYSIHGAWGMFASYQLFYDLRIDFQGIPQEGIYTTSSYSEWISHPNKVVVRLEFNSEVIEIQSGGKVYIEELDNNGLKITFCELNYTSTVEETLQGTFTTLD